MDMDPAQEAIQAALKGEWDQAIQLNKAILQSNPKDVDALNRMAKAYFEKGDIKNAKSFAKKTLDIDPFNTIATKCLGKWKNVTAIKKNGHSSQTIKITGMFLEESGKTKIAKLLNLGSSKTIASIDTGDEVKLSAHTHKVSVLTSDGQYIGKVADDISARLRRFIKLGNKYQVLVKSVAPKDVKIFIREVERSDKLSDTNTFAAEKIDYVSFTHPILMQQNSKQDNQHENDDS